MIVDMAGVSRIPAVAEPWCLVFDVKIEAPPVMLPRNLGAAGPAIEAAVRSFS